MDKFGIENLKKIISLPIELGNIGSKIGEESSKNWKKWFLLIESFDELLEFIKVDWTILRNELEDLDGDELNEIAFHVQGKFDISNDKLELIIEESIDLLIKLSGVVGRAISLSKKI